MKSTFCLYYTALLCKERTWLVAGILRNETNLVFDRCVDKQACRFEFFVPEHSQNDFLEIMRDLVQKNLVFGLQQQPNRLEIACAANKDPLDPMSLG